METARSGRRREEALGEELAAERPGRAWARWALVLLALRLATGLIGVIASVKAPLTAAEQRIPLALGEAGLGPWLYRLLVLPWLRWDAVYYTRLVEQGYQPSDPAIQFHPLYPWLATPLHALLGSGLLALLIVSSLAVLALLVVFERLARLDLPPAQAQRATLLLALIPPAFCLLAPYNEGLFLLCSALVLLWAREQRWWLAGLAGAAAAFTRQQGVFLAIPMLWEMAQAAGGWRALARRGRWWPALALPALGLVAFLLFRALALGDVDFNWREPRSWIYSFVISKKTEQIVPVQAFLLPPHAFWLGLRRLASPNRQTAIDMGLGVLFLALLAYGWRRLRPSYRAYSAVLLLVAFAFYTGPTYPYMGLPRHLLLAIPLVLPLAPLLETPRQRFLTLSGFGMGYMLLTYLYFYQGWVP